MRTLALVFVVFFSAQAAAQSPERADDLSAPHATSAPTLEVDLAEVEHDLQRADAEAASPSRWRVFRGALLGGALATGASVGSSALLAFAAYRRCDPPAATSLSTSIHCSFPASQAILYTAAFAYAPTIAGGAAVGARLAGGVGRYDLALVGSSLGTAVGFLSLAGLAYSDSDRAAVVGFVLLPVLQWLGGAIGAASGSLRRERSLGPTLSLGRDGGTLGLAGRF
jgi:hypothetical protein